MIRISLTSQDDPFTLLSVLKKLFLIALLLIGMFFAFSFFYFYFTNDYFLGIREREYCPHVKCVCVIEGS